MWIETYQIMNIQKSNDTLLSNAKIDLMLVTAFDQEAFCAKRTYYKMFVFLFILHFFEREVIGMLWYVSWFLSTGKILIHSYLNMPCLVFTGGNTTRVF